MSTKVGDQWKDGADKLNQNQVVYGSGMQFVGELLCMVGMLFLVVLSWEQGLVSV